MQKHLQCKIKHSQVKYVEWSYLKVNAWTDQWQQDLISECSQGLRSMLNQGWNQIIITNLDDPLTQIVIQVRPRYDLNLTQFN